MGAIHCEYCLTVASYRITIRRERLAVYKRYSCATHRAKLDRLAIIDNGSKVKRERMTCLTGFAEGTGRCLAPMAYATSSPGGTSGPSGSGSTTAG